ncbi:hypothetical protein CEUSTIGMA_g4246.t1 [Chlamydomonas eustigma]|uniref:Uncharacterized protein n=1 Tax=Chlamydomonas eustigma TaxID=1157962 RepID=A0A250X230_9CHLO|nr:hypothetical protein CEUSTIGMA_g4246.t1 [Chlamydomonas eustigma]|eukprot:GAX76800.1 hypothetical protein CEUSTIGMA_g4246.t1 [Chlamydomonas eustigma]
MYSLLSQSHTSALGPSSSCHDQRNKSVFKINGTFASIFSKPKILATVTQQPLQASFGSKGVDAYPLASEIPSSVPERMGEAARKALSRASSAMNRYGWISFWVQLTLSLVSAVILLFSVAFTTQSGPLASLYLTLVGILAGFLSTFWNFGYTRTARKMQVFLEASPGSGTPKIKKHNVIDMVTKGIMVNVVGLGSTLLGIQALVGVLVAKTLSNSAANPFISSAAGVYNPVLALDVFLVQAATNILLGHFLSLVCSLWLLNVVGEGRGLRFQRFVGIQSLKKRLRDGDGGTVISKGNSLVFNMGSVAGGQLGFGGPDVRGGRGASSSSRGGGTSGNASSAALAATEAPSNRAGTLSTSGNISNISNKGVTSGSSRTTGDVVGGWGGGGRRGGSTAIRPVVGATTPTAALAYSEAARQMSLESSSNWDAAAQQQLMLKTMRRSVPIAIPGQPASAHRPFDLLIFPTESSLRYLDGSQPGDYGFDPLSLYNPANGSKGFLSRPWLRCSEIIHARWAMLGMMGCLAPEWLANHDMIPEENGVTWFRTGWLPLAGEDMGSRSDPNALLTVMALPMSIAELTRLRDFDVYTNASSTSSGNVIRGGLLSGALAAGSNRKSPAGSWVEEMKDLIISMETTLSSKATGDPAYPGGPVFNPSDLVRDTSTSLEDFKEIELINGRLAMVAFLVLCAQAVVTGKGPFQNLDDHLSDPFNEQYLLLP